MDLESVRVEHMGAHLQSRGITAESARGMDEHQARHQMASAGIVNLPSSQHGDLWGKVISSLEGLS